MRFAYDGITVIIARGGELGTEGKSQVAILKQDFEKELWASFRVVVGRWERL